MVLSEEDIEKKNLKHRARNAAYHFQLPAYMQIITRLNAVPLLDLNMVTLLEALTDLLGKVASFDGYRPPDHGEYDLRQQEVAFTFGCRFCKSKSYNARQVLDHIMTDDHRQLTLHDLNRLQKFRINTRNNLREFMFRKQEIMRMNNLHPGQMDTLLDFYLITKNFLKMTSRYLSSLNKLEWVPSKIVAQEVLELLNLIDLLVTKAKCIESVPRFATILQQLLPNELMFAVKGKMFESVHSAIDHATSGMRMPPSVYQNVFSLPPIPPANDPHYQPPPPDTLTGSPIVSNIPRPHFTPNHQPAVLMPPMSMPPPPLTAALIRLGIDMHVVNNGAQNPQLQSQQQHLLQHQQQLLFNPSMMRMSIQQQHMTFQYPPPQLPPPMCPGVLNSPPPMDKNRRLPPVHQAVLSANVLRFLENPNVDSLVANGNDLMYFAKSSLIPGELKCALKAVAPNTRVCCFGAKVSGVGYEEDQVNLFIDDGIYPKTLNSVNKLIETLKSFINENNNEWVLQDIQENETRTHLTVKNTCENVLCCMTFDSEINCHNSKLINYYIKTFPMYQKLCYFVQEFTTLVDLGFNRYIIIVLVLFYLQKRDHLPSVAQLQSKVSEEKIIGPWLANFTPCKPEDFKLTPCETDLRKSATDFFLFYGKQFSFQESVVCPQIGLALNRTDFLVDRMWKMPLKRYKAYVEECLAKEGAAGDSFAQFKVTSMCVQDPLVLTANIASHVSSDDTGKFVHMCNLAYNFCSNN